MRIDPTREQRLEIMRRQLAHVNAAVFTLENASKALSKSITDLNAEFANLAKDIRDEKQHR